MSEVDRLSDSGLYPALAPGDQRRRDAYPRQPRPDSAAAKPDPGATSQAQRPRHPKSLIDEYA